MLVILIGMEIILFFISRNYSWQTSIFGLYTGKHKGGPGGTVVNIASMAGVCPYI